MHLNITELLLKTNHYIQKKYAQIPPPNANNGPLHWAFQYTRLDPPSYVAIGANDGIASPSVMRKTLKTK